jgi:hypothetical protein
LNDNIDIGIKPKRRALMSEDSEEYSEYDEDVEDWPEDTEEVDEALIEKVETLKEGGAWWAEDILDIENEQLCEKAIESSERFVEKKRAAVEKFESEGKDLKYFFSDHPHLVTEAVKTASRISMATVGITGGDLGDVAEDMRLLNAQDLESLKAKDHVRSLLEQVDPEVGEELAEKVIEEEEVPEEAAESLRRLTRLRALGPK